jgi:hypothetical protein
MIGFSCGLVHRAQSGVKLIVQFRDGFVPPINLHLDLAFLGVQHHRLLAQPSHHVERTLRRAPQRQLLHVGRQAPLDYRAQFLRNRKVPIRRTQPLQGLVGTFVIVELHPHPHPLLRLLEALELGAGQKLRPDRFPEPLNLAQRHRMMRLAAEVMDMILGQFPFKPRLAAPVGVLPAIVRQHLLGNPKLARRPPIDFQHVLRRLAAIQSQPHHVPRVIVHEPNQIRVLPANADRADVALPHLIRSRPLKETRLGRIPPGFAPRLLDELFLMQHPPHRLPTHRQQVPSSQQLRDLLHPQRRLLFLQGRDLFAHRRGQSLPLRTLLPNRMRRVPQPGLAFAPITTQPLGQRAGANPQFAQNQVRWKPFFQPQLDRLQTELKRIDGPTAAPRKPPRGLGGILLLF